MISEFKEGNMTADLFFTDLESMLVPVSGGKFETTNWEISAQIARKYNVLVDLLYVGKNPKKIEKVIQMMDNYGVKYNIIIKKKNGKPVAKIITDVYNKGNYQLITMASRRSKGFVDRLFNTSVSKKIVDTIDTPLLQVHPPKYHQRKSDIANMFLLFDGSDRDFYLSRYASIFASVGKQGNTIAYHVVEIPMIMSPEDVADLPVIKRSADNFQLYAQRITSRVGLDVQAKLLYGHSIVLSLKGATEIHEPDAVLIGHTKDSGIWNSLRTRLAYRIMREINSSVIVYHAPEVKK